jgi:AbrB family looped-hinge helix DNA binding protein
MRRAVAKLSGKNQIVMPRAVRETLHVKGGDKILFVIEGEQVRVYAQPESIAKYSLGLGKETWRLLDGGEAHLRSERASWVD